MSNIKENFKSIDRIEEHLKWYATVSEYARDIANIWPLDKRKSAVYYWHYVVKHAAKICESVRRNDWHIAAESLGELIVWWLGFMYKVTTKPDDDTDAEKVVQYIDADIDEIIWNKYPGFCPACFTRRIQENKRALQLFRNVRNELDNENSVFDKIMKNQEIQKIIKDLNKKPQCTCLGKKRETEERFEKDTPEKVSEDFKKFVSVCLTAYTRKLKVQNTKKSIKPKSMKEFCDLFRKIYENNIEALSIEEIAFHLLEEVGEVSTALTELFTMELAEIKPEEAIIKRKWKVRDLAEELADIFSWSNSLACKINRHLNCAKLLLEVFTKPQEKTTTYKAVVELFDNIIKKTQNPVDLVWELHRTSYVYDQQAPQTGSYLGCEKCKHMTCNREHKSHKNERGFITGKLTANEVDILMKGSKIY